MIWFVYMTVGVQMVSVQIYHIRLIRGCSRIEAAPSDVLKEIVTALE